MVFDRHDEGSIDYQQCRYGQSKLLFRGPRRSLAKEYYAFIGGTETYGKFIEKPFVEQVEEAKGLACANFSTVNAGVDAFMHDPSLLGLCRRSEATIIQVMGAQNMSNRFYSVHARRNDRFLKASTLLRSIYPEVDFTEFSFTRHMLTSLKRLCSRRFAAIEIELRAAWLARMELLLRQIIGRKVLLWLQEPLPELGSDACTGAEPLFIDSKLVEQLEPSVDEIIRVDVSGGRGDLTGKTYSPLQEPAARVMLGLEAHEKIAQRLIAAL